MEFNEAKELLMRLDKARGTMRLPGVFTVEHEDSGDYIWTKKDGSTTARTWEGTLKKLKTYSSKSARRMRFSGEVPDPSTKSRPGAVREYSIWAQTAPNQQELIHTFEGTRPDGYVLLDEYQERDGRERVFYLRPGTKDQIVKTVARIPKGGWPEPPTHILERSDLYKDAEKKKELVTA